MLLMAIARWFWRN